MLAERGEGLSAVTLAKQLGVSDRRVLAVLGARGDARLQARS